MHAHIVNMYCEYDCQHCFMALSTCSYLMPNESLTREYTCTWWCIMTRNQMSFHQSSLASDKQAQLLTDSHVAYDCGSFSSTFISRLVGNTVNLTFCKELTFTSFDCCLQPLNPHPFVLMLQCN